MLLLSSSTVNTCHVIGVPSEERDGGAEKIVKGLTIFQIWQNNINQIQKAKWTPRRQTKNNPNKAQNSHTENKSKGQKISKAARGKWNISFRGKTMRMETKLLIRNHGGQNSMAHFSDWKEFYIQWNVLLKWRENQVILLWLVWLRTDENSRQAVLGAPAPTGSTVVPGNDKWAHRTEGAGAYLLSDFHVSGRGGEGTHQNREHRGPWEENLLCSSPGLAEPPTAHHSPAP